MLPTRKIKQRGIRGRRGGGGKRRNKDIKKKWG